MLKLAAIVQFSTFFFTWNTLTKIKQSDHLIDINNLKYTLLSYIIIIFLQNLAQTAKCKIKFIFIVSKRERELRCHLH